MIHYIEPYYQFDSNVYLLTGDSNLLIDSGTGLSSDYIIRSVKDVIGSYGKLDKVLLTHCHFDHIGAGRMLIDAFGCKVYAGSKDAVPVRQSDDKYTLARSFGVDIGPYPVEGLEEGDVIDIGEHRLRVIDTPGHTLGGVCYFDEISSSLFSGDTVFAVGIGRTDFNGGSLDSLRNSLRKLCNMPVTGLYPGHGQPTSDGMASIRRGLQMAGE